jgi:hypothetical protein
MKLVYIAGPYSADTPLEIEQNVAIAITAGNKIAGVGFAVFIPHLYHYWQQWYYQEYDFWMRQDKELLNRCDCLVRLPGKSNRADKEVHHALTVLHIPVWFGVEAFLNDNRSR